MFHQALNPLSQVGFPGSGPYPVTMIQVNVRYLAVSPGRVRRYTVGEEGHTGV